MIFVTSDLHLFHKNIIKLKKRPFSSVDEMADVLIGNWNSVVSSEDIVFVLGDFIGKEAVDNAQIEHMAGNMNGKKILIKGNHDENYPMRNMFDRVYERRHVHSVEYRGTTFYLNHWLANMTVAGDYPNSLYLHGHAHNGIGYNVLNAYIRRPCFDVGVDANGFAPVSLDDILNRFNNPPTNLPKFKCSKCGGRMHVVDGPHGKFLGCYNYPKCSFAVDMNIDRRTAEEKNLARKQRRNK